MRARRCGGFVFSLLVILLFSLEGFVPALILVGLHFILGWSLWWAALAAVVWIAIVTLRVAFISWVARCGNTPAPPQENKNPYSVRKTEFGKRSETHGEDADRRDNKVAVKSIAFLTATFSASECVKYGVSLGPCRAYVCLKKSRTSASYLRGSMK